MIVDLSPVKKLLDMELSALKDNKKTTLEIITIGEDFASQKYIGIKKRLAESYGITTHVKDFDKGLPLDYILEECSGSNIPRIIQLPIPQQYSAVLQTLTPENDADALIPETTEARPDLIPPTIRAIDLTLQQILTGSASLNSKVDLKGKSIAVIGKGKLVGTPLLSHVQHCSPDAIISVDKSTQDPKSLTKEVDIVVSATGQSGLIDQSWLKDDAIVIDAGTSESNGALKGDIDTSHLYDSVKLVPSPGGIGPLTVRCLFYNTFLLSRK